MEQQTIERARGFTWQCRDQESNPGFCGHNALYYHYTITANLSQRPGEPKAHWVGVDYCGCPSLLCLKTSPQHTLLSSTTTGCSKRSLRSNFTTLSPNPLVQTLSEEHPQTNNTTRVIPDSPQFYLDQFLSVARHFWSPCSSPDCSKYQKSPSSGATSSLDDNSKFRDTSFAGVMPSHLSFLLFKLETVL